MMNQCTLKISFGKGEKVKKKLDDTEKALILSLIVIGILLMIVFLSGCTAEHKIRDPNNHVTPFGKVAPKECSTNV